jgi:titin
VTGWPRPTITWFVDGTVIKSSADFQMSYDEASGRCVLAIGDVLPEDEGQYKVTAVNEVGTSSSTAYLTVQRKLPGCCSPTAYSYWQLV